MLDKIIISAKVVINIGEWIRSQTDLWQDMKVKINLRDREISLFDYVNHIEVSTRPFSYFEGEK